MNEILTWEERLAAMDHSRGTSDKMRKAAMLAEIKELRKAVQQHDKRLAVANQAALIAFQRGADSERAKILKQQSKGTK